MAFVLKVKDKENKKLGNRYSLSKIVGKHDKNLLDLLVYIYCTMYDTQTELEGKIYLSQKDKVVQKSAMCSYLKILRQSAQ